jgi:glycopeptide antibiotics resistance protein
VRERAVSVYLGLILFVGTCVVLLTAVLSAWRARRGWAVRRAIWRSGLEAAILGSLVGIAALTLNPSPGMIGENWFDLVPFHVLFNSIRLGEFWVRIALFDLLGNVLLYAPLGLLVALRFQRLPVRAWILLAVALPTAIEVIQATVLARSGDITDIIANATGGIAGFILGRLLQRAPSEVGHR